ncbi:MAG: tRNA (adenosine(37)-N6)-threonylcarbamoyltransferase complex ATPase subunit type 1 TsaE [Clostridia bacterium]|nr:tRNA (adenosine(37)-N6)-threonylcarbamoyltransferase complex ATPase subunit type 1 TsaE [Clostridia bacterium]
MEYLSHSIEETYALAKNIADKCIGGETILLNGDLGAGKTTFTKGFALALGINKQVTSPTFTLLKEYSGLRLKLYHFDLYRIETTDELEELGFEDYIGEKDAVCVIEWNKISGLKDPITITIEKISDFERKFLISGDLL